jgi:hypothetical protein
MRRPAGAREALRGSPLVQAGTADAPGIERVPLMTAATRPSVFFPGRPATERAPDTRISRTLALLFFEFAIQNN